MKKHFPYALSLLVSAAFGFVTTPSWGGDRTDYILSQTATSGPTVDEPVAAVPAPVGYMPSKIDPPKVVFPDKSMDSGAIKSVLSAAYASSPVLRAGRESLRQQYENVIQAESGYRPNISVDGGVAAAYGKTDPGGDETYVPRDIGVSATQYIYRGGRTLAEVDQQLGLSKAAESAYDSLVQETFLNIVISALDVQSTRATISLNEKNREVLSRQLSAAQRGFEVGELTRTDVAQAKARLSGADAQIVMAKAAYENARALYKRYTGQSADTLTFDSTSVIPQTPASLEQAISAATTAHPAVRGAIAAVEAAQKGVDVAEAGLLPTVYLAADASQAWDPTALLDESRSASLGMRASLPLYEAGATRSQIRQAKLGVYEKENQVEEVRRAVEQAATNAWNALQSAQAAVSAFDRQVEAAQMARDGVYKEREVGIRTLLDTLDADAELLAAEVGLVKARRDVAVSAYALLASTGGLTGSFIMADKALPAVPPIRTFSTSVEPAD